MTRPHPKLADRLAARLRRRILLERLAPGTRLGTLTEIIEELDVSRGSAVEAVRLLEHQGLVRVKPGPNGGVYVTSPDTDTVVRAAASYLQMAGSDPATLFSARLVVEPPLARLAAERAAADGTVEERLRVALEAEAGLLTALAEQGSRAGVDALNEQSFALHLEIAKHAANEPLALCCEVLLNLGEIEGARYTYDDEPLHENHRAHEQIVRAIVAGRGDAAERSMHRHLTATFAWVESEERAAHFAVRG